VIPVINLGWIRRINLQIIWLHFSNNVEILLVMSLSPPNFYMTQNQSSVIKLSSFIFLPPEVSDSKTPGGGHVSSNIYTKGTLKLLSPNFFMPQSLFVGSFIFEKIKGKK